MKSQGVLLPSIDCDSENHSESPPVVLSLSRLKICLSIFWWKLSGLDAGQMVKAEVLSPLLTG